MAYATDVARERNARMTLLTVVPRMPPVTWPLALAYDPRAIAEGSARALRLASRHVPPDVPVTLELAHGGVARQVVWRAASGGHALIVLGPSTAAFVVRRVTRRASVPVVVVDW